MFEEKLISFHHDDDFLSLSRVEFHEIPESDPVRIAFTEVQKVLAEGNSSLLHGPSQSGKTTVLLELIQQSEKEAKYIAMDALGSNKIKSLDQRLKSKNGEYLYTIVCLDELGALFRFSDDDREIALSYIRELKNAGVMIVGSVTGVASLRVKFPAYLKKIEEWDLFESLVEMPKIKKSL